MQTTPERFKQPKFRDGVSYSKSQYQHHLDYRQQGVTIDVDGGDESIGNLLNALIIGGKSPETLKYEHPELSEQIEDIIAQLDNNYLLTESSYLPVKDTLSGKEFCNLIKRYTNAWHTKLGTSALYEVMKNGSASRTQLIGFAIEYYHIVKAAPCVIAPALSQNCPRPVFEGIKQLFLEEHDHDKLLLKALSVAGISEEKVRETTPLPGTFSVYCTLGTFARQHLLSFISSLFLFEEPYPEFNEKFVENCKIVGLPDEFWKPIVGHSAVNEEGGHHLITDELLEHISAISPEEARVTLIHIMTLLETMKLWDSQICDFYSESLNLRVFS